MKIIDVISLAIPDVKVIKFGRFNDNRGYFTETLRNSDFQHHPGTSFMNGIKFLQINEAYSKAHTVRGLHFQWNPYMGKLVRVIKGRMIDVGLDIRKGSPNFGKIVGYELSADQSGDNNEWIWIPPGFAHGVIIIEESLVEYLCSGEYSPGCEAAISPLAKDIDWSLCDKGVKKTYDSIVPATKLMTDKDKNGNTLASWKAHKDSDNFIYGKT
jgi:dTDP-4-dehydrorhamnose 3,5-epimerase